MNKILQRAVLMALALLSIGMVHAQVTLQTSPYFQNFDGLASGLPVGWTVRTGATGTDLGVVASFTSAATSWATSSGNFRNVASGNGLVSTTSSTNQGTATNRALGLRQTGSFGNNDAAFLIQIDNTLGKANFTLSFSLQSLDVASPRVATWLVQIAKGDAPSVFTTVTTVPEALTTGGSAFSAQTVTANLNNLLDDEAGPVWIRVVTLSPTTGSGNRPTSAIDDFSLAWTSTSAPAINLSKTNIDFAATEPGTKSAPLTYRLSGTNLSAAVQLSVTGPFEISKDGSNYTTDLSFTATEAAANPEVSVRFAPVAEGAENGSITHSSTGAATRTLNLSGIGQAASTLAFNFNSCSVSGSPGNGFTTFNVAGDQVWQCTSFGKDGTNGVQINGFAAGSAQLNEDWLISAPLDLSALSLPVLQFYSSVSFSGPGIEVLVSTNYSGTGNPNSATWTSLNADFATAGTSGFRTSGDILLQNYRTNGVYIAFKYTSSSTLGAARWTIDDVSVRNAANFFTVSPSTLDFGEVSTSESSEGKPVSFQSIGGVPISWQIDLPYELSKDSLNYSAALAYSPEEAAMANRFFVRVRPSFKALQILDSVKLNMGGATTGRVAVRTSSLPASETLDIVTLNVEFLGNTISADGPANKTLQRQNVAAVINRLQPDVLAIQEVASDAVMTSLMADLGGNYDYILSDRWSYSFDGPDPTFPPQKIGFIYRKATVSVLGSRVLFREVYDAARAGAPSPITGYPTGTSSSFFASGRLPFMVQFSATNGSITKQFKAVVLHGKSGGSNLIDWQRRQFDSKALYDTLQAFHGSDPVVVLGDFNDRLAGSINPGQSSSYGIFLNAPVDFRPVTLPADQAGLTSFLGSGGNMIDHILISNEWFTEYIDSSAAPVDARNFITNYGSTTSDHLPVIARFDLKVSSILPVQLVSFGGTPKKDGIELEWLTTGESALSHFEIERSENGISFRSLDRVAALGSGAGLYRFLDTDPLPGANYYRLKMVDQNGRYKYSSVIKVAAVAVVLRQFTLYPNPVQGSGVQIRLSNAEPAASYHWEVLDAAGHIKGSGTGQLSAVNQSLSELSRKMPAGMYMVKLRDAKNQYAARMIIAR